MKINNQEFTSNYTTGVQSAFLSGSDRTDKVNQAQLKAASTFSCKPFISENNSKVSIFAGESQIEVPDASQYQRRSLHIVEKEAATLDKMKIKFKNGLSRAYKQPSGGIKKTTHGSS